MAMENSRNFVAKAQGAFGDMTRPGQGTMSDAKGAFADMTSTGGKGGMAEPGDGRKQNDDGVVADKGGWMYRDLGDGRIEIMQAPQGSKMAGKILDPKMIDAIKDPTQRARAGKAYASIKSVLAGGEAIPSSGGGKKAPPTTGAASNQYTGTTDRLRAEGTPADSSVGGVGAVEGPMPSGVGNAQSTIMREMPAKQPTRSSGGR